MFATYTTVRTWARKHDVRFWMLEVGMPLAAGAALMLLANLPYHFFG